MKKEISREISDNSRKNKIRRLEAQKTPAARFDTSDPVDIKAAY